MAMALVLASVLVFMWLLLRSRRRATRRNVDTVARLTGHSDFSQLQASVALAVRAGVVPSQARTHRSYLVDMFGEPAVDMAASMILNGTFDVRFKGQSLESALDTLSQEVPDPRIGALVENVINEASATPQPARVNSPPAVPAQSPGKLQSSTIQRITPIESNGGPRTPYRVVWPFLTLAALLAVALLDMPLSYYGILRLLVVGVSIYGLVSGRSANWSPRLLVFGPPLVLWGMIRGPGRDFWVPFDLVGAAWFVAAAATYRIADYRRRHADRPKVSAVRNWHALTIAVLAIVCVGLAVALAVSLSSPARSRQSTVFSSDSVALHQVASSSDCISSMSVEPELVGTLERRTYPGRPGYASVESGDEPETGFYLALLVPICFSGDAVEGMDPMPSFPIWDIQLLLDSAGYQRLRDSLTKVVHVKGSLSPAFTGHHHVPVLMDVDLGATGDTVQQ